LVSERVDIVTNSADETRRVGKILGELARPGEVFLLVGDLGSGKTTLTQGILWGLGGEEYARSPTFVLVSEYEGRLTLYHVDLYRLSAADDSYDLGLDEYLDSDGLCVVEWADKAPHQFSNEHLKVNMRRLGDTTRRLSFSCGTAGYERYLGAVRLEAERN
jgi:tRNA threonylcarbamoyladenosine biosynthesis protein TsaE